jgi:hypothetical protein
MLSSGTRSAVVGGAAKAAAASLIAIAMIMLASGQTMATPAFAQKTGQPCTKCHTAPPVLNDYGKKFKESNK